MASKMHTSSFLRGLHLEDEDMDKLIVDYLLEINKQNSLNMINTCLSGCNQNKHTNNGPLNVYYTAMNETQYDNNDRFTTCDDYIYVIKHQPLSDKTYYYYQVYVTNNNAEIYLVDDYQINLINALPLSDGIDCIGRKEHILCSLKLDGRPYYYQVKISTDNTEIYNESNAHALQQVNKIYIIFHFGIYGCYYWCMNYYDNVIVKVTIYNLFFAFRLSLFLYYLLS
eukprot:366539_1